MYDTTCLGVDFWVKLVSGLGCPWLGAAVGGTVLVQGDITAVTGVVIVYTNVATLVLYKPTFLLTAGLTDADSKEEEEQ